jgi:hypothetical protein
MFKRDRQASKRALFPLVVLASVFVLPTYRACGEEPFHSPAHFAWGDVPMMASWIAPLFLVAGVLALLTVRALRVGEVDRTTRRLGLASLAVMAASTSVGAVAMNELSRSWWPFAVVAASLAGAFVVVRGGRGKPAWRIWERIVAGFSFLALASGPVLVLGGEVLFGNRTHVAVGAWLALGAVASLAFVSMGAVVRGKQ